MLFCNLLLRVHWFVAKYVHITIFRFNAIHFFISLFIYVCTRYLIEREEMHEYKRKNMKE